MNIEHIAMYVMDLEKAKDFFIKYFHGVSNSLYHNQKTGFKSYFITFENGARLELMYRPDMINEKKELVRTGFIHLAFSVGSREQVDALTNWLKGDGYTIISGPRVTGDGYYESCIEGIEGNQIEITE